MCVNYKRYLIFFPILHHFFNPCLFSQKGIIFKKVIQIIFLNHILLIPLALIATDLVMISYTGLRGGGCKGCTHNAPPPTGSSGPLCC